LEFKRAFICVDTYAPKGSSYGDAWISFDKVGIYTVRLGGNSSLGGWARQIAEVVVNITDSNANGIVDQWETKYSLTGTGAAIAAGDPDGDGKTNLQEFINGSDPLVGSGTTAPATTIDNIAPKVTAPTNIMVAAINAAGAPASNAVIAAFLVGGSATDNVDTAPTVTSNAPIQFPLGTTIVTFSSTDIAGNIGTATATVTVKVASKDTTPPVITLIGKSVVTVSQGATYVDAGATAKDIVDGNLTTSIATRNAVNTSVIGTYIVSYNVSDLSGNPAITVTRTVNVIGKVATLNNGLVAYYPFDGNTNDVSGNGNNATIVGGATFVAGKTDQAIYINNPSGAQTVTQYVKLPNSLTITSLNQSSFTVNICYKTTDAAQMNGRLFGSMGAASWIVMDYNAGGQPQAYSAVKGGVSSFYVALSQTKNPKAVVTDGAIHCEALTLNRAKGMLSQYIDGRLIEAVSVSGTGSISMNNLVLGAAKVGDTYGARLTTVDDLRIYNRALSGSEVAQLAGNSLNNGLVAYYPFDGNVNDASGNGNNGVPTAITYAAGHSGQAASFNGVSSNVRVTDNLKLDLITSFTLSAWVKPNAGYGKEVNGTIEILSKWGNLGNASYALSTNASGQALFLTHDGVSSTWLGGGNLH